MRWIILLLVQGVAGYILSASPEPFFPNCYENDDRGLTAQIHVLLGADFHTKHRHNAARHVHDLLGLARVLLTAQFRVSVNASVLPFSIQVRDECDVQKTQLDILAWQIPGFVLFVSGCEYVRGGMSGIAKVGSFCDKSSVAVATEDELDIAHELGHVFGATHTIGLGGIMDYGLGLVNGEYAFHPKNRNEVCLFLRRVQTSASCAAKISEISCGNGVIEGNESCECLSLKQHCFGCRECQTNRTCSLTQFIRKPRFAKSFMAARYADLASAECCFRGKIRVNGPCGQSGVCSVLGTCQNTCEDYGFEPCETLGCVQTCRIGRSCERLTHALTGSILTNLHDGAPCVFGMNKRGVCLHGLCVRVTRYSSNL